MRGGRGRGRGGGGGGEERGSEREVFLVPILAAMRVSAEQLVIAEAHGSALVDGRRQGQRRGGGGGKGGSKLGGDCDLAEAKGCVGAGGGRRVGRCEGEREGLFLGG